MESSTSCVTQRSNFVVIDVETTGLSRHEDRIVQIACLKVDKSGEKSSWMTYVNPCTDRPRQLNGGYRIHHIPPDMLLKKPKFREVAKSLWKFLDDADVIVAYNCLFDWDMLLREFRRLDQSESSKNGENWESKFTSKSLWVDALRLAILKYPRLANHKLSTVAKHLNIEVKSSTTYSYKSSLNTGNWEGLSVVEQGQAKWQDGAHDAMCDVLTTYEVLLQCLQSHTKNSMRELVIETPQIVLDTILFLGMENIVDRGKTVVDDDLMPFASRAKNYFSTYRPKGKVIGEISKGFLYGCLNSLQLESNKDDRIILIYKAAFLDPPSEEEKQDTRVNDSLENHEKKRQFKTMVASDLTQVFRQKKPRLSTQLQ